MEVPKGSRVAQVDLEARVLRTFSVEHCENAFRSPCDPEIYVVLFVYVGFADLLPGDWAAFRLAVRILLRSASIAWLILSFWRLPLATRLT